LHLGRLVPARGPNCEEQDKEDSGAPHESVSLREKPAPKFQYKGARREVKEIVSCQLLERLSLALFRFTLTTIN
jgi:hypothetical protein